MYTVGIDVGSVSINCVVLDARRELIYEHPYQRHFGRIAPQTVEVLRAVFEQCGPHRIERLAFTGNHGKISAARLGVPYEYESITQSPTSTSPSPSCSAYCTWCHMPPRSSAWVARTPHSTDCPTRTDSGT